MFKLKAFRSMQSRVPADVTIYQEMATLVRLNGATQYVVEILEAHASAYRSYSATTPRMQDVTVGTLAMACKECNDVTATAAIVSHRGHVSLSTLTSTILMQIFR